MTESLKYQQQFRRLKRFYELFENINKGIIINFPSSYLEDVAYAFFIFCYHVKDWLEYVGKNRMILITRDKKIKRRAAELRAFKNYKVGAFILGGQNPGIWQIIKQIINNWLRIKDLASDTRAPFIFKVPLKGKIVQLQL